MRHPLAAYMADPALLDRIPAADGTPVRPALASAASSRLARLSDQLYLAALCGLPFPFGSIELAWVAAFVAGVAASLLIADWSGVPPSARRLALTICAVVGIILGVVTVQAWPGAPLGEADPIWAEIGPIIGRELVLRVSAVSGAAVHAVGPTLLAGLVAVRTLVYARDAERARRVLLCVGWTAVAAAVYGILAALALDKLLMAEKMAYHGAFTGPFVNRNTAATYFGSAAAVWLALGLSEVRGRTAHSARARRRLAVAAAAGLFCLGAVAATGSRAGFLLCGLTVSVLGLLFVAVRPFTRRTRWGGAAVAVAVLALVLDFWGGFVATRLEAGVLDAGRLGVYRAVVGMIAERPWFGWGLGAFEAVFPAYRGADVGSWGIWEMVHSTPLEVALELGLLVAAGLGALWIAAAAILVRAALAAAPAWNAGAGAAIGVGLLGTLHSCVDFSLQVPGYAAPFFAVVCAGLAQALAPAVVQPSH